MIRAAAAILVLAGAAAAHEAPTGWVYDARCCSGWDCAVLPDGSVTATAEGWAVRFGPGVHRMAPDGWAGLVPYDAEILRRSGDEDFHLCLNWSRRVLCFYAPPMGM